MKTQRTWQYLTMATLLSIWGCTSTKQVAQRSGEVDDLYASSANAVVFADNRQEYTEQKTERSLQPQRQRSGATLNPDYTDEKVGYNQNQDEYYTELTTRKLQRGLSADPGWGGSADDYNAGFVNGYNAGSLAYNSWSWNRWGYNNPFNSGFSIGLGMGSAWGWNNWGLNRWNTGFYDPYWGSYSSMAYSPWGYDPYWSYNPWNYGYGGYYGGGYYGGGWGRPVIVNNNVVVNGADPYRNYRNSGPRTGSGTGRYNSDFVNSAPSYNPNGGRGAAGTNNPRSTYSSANGSPSSSDGYYARPRQNSRGGSYYYENGASTSGGRTSSGNSSSGYTAPSYSNSGSSDYYARPRQNSRGSSYTPPSTSSDYSGGRSATYSARS